MSLIGLDRTANQASVSGPPTAWDYFADRAFRALAHVGVCLILLLLAFILWTIGGKALVAVGDHGLRFLTSTTWDVGRQQFGVLPQIWGTLYSSLLALAIGGFFGVAMAIFLTQDFLEPRLAQVFRTIVELLAAIPSVVYGLWVLFVVVPAMRPLAGWLYEHLGWIPFFGTTLSGPGMWPASLVLAIMILPTVAAVSQDALRLVPLGHRQGRGHRLEGAGPLVTEDPRDRRIVESRAGPVEDEPPRAKPERPVGVPPRVFHVMERGDHGETGLRRDPTERLHDRGAIGHIEARHGLVTQDEPRLLGEDLGDGHPLLLPTR